MLFIPYCLIWPFKTLFSKVRDVRMDSGNLFALISVAIGGLILILGFCGVLGTILNGIEYFLNDVYVRLFGFPLTKSWSNVVVNLREKINLDKSSINYLLMILACLFYAITGPVDFALNLIVAIGLLILIVIYLVYGLIFVYGLGALVCIPVVINFISAARNGESKGLPTIFLLISIAITIIYYLNMKVFYY